MSHPTKIALSLFVVGLLAGGCNSQLGPPASNTGSVTPAGGSGAGGSSGAGGAPAAGGSSGERPLGTLNGVCFPEDRVCVAACSVVLAARAANTCVENVPTCPAGYTLQSDCAEDACVQYRLCCDETTGSIDTPPACGDDGLFSCPAGNHLADDDCIPTNLGVTDCETLRAQPCDQPNQQCISHGLYCSCSVQPPGTTGLLWGCWVPAP